MMEAYWLSEESPMSLSMTEPTVGSQPAKLQMPVLGEYTDFRQFLKDVYEYRRAIEGTSVRPYSYSTFSAAADIKSPNYLKLIIEGRRNLSEDMMTKFAKAVRLNREETLEFKALVRYGQASQPIERNHFLKELADLRARKEFESGSVSASTWEKVPSWIGWVLYAMADQKDVKFDTTALHKLFRVKVNPEDVRQSLQKLLETGELVKS